MRLLARKKIRFQADFYAVLSTESKESPRSSLRAVSATFFLLCFLILKESTCETRKNVFYFTSKALSDLEKIKIRILGMIIS